MHARQKGNCRPVACGRPLPLSGGQVVPMQEEPDCLCNGRCYMAIHRCLPYLEPAKRRRGAALSRLPKLTRRQRGCPVQPVLRPVRPQDSEQRGSYQERRLARDCRHPGQLSLPHLHGGHAADALTPDPRRHRGASEHRFAAVGREPSLPSLRTYLPALLLNRARYSSFRTHHSSLASRRSSLSARTRPSCPAAP